MKTEKELYSAILEITMKIQIQFPELKLYMAETPVLIPNVQNPKIDPEVLQQYYNSLHTLLKDYIKNSSKILKLI